jgi:hypothetical protein
MQLELEVVDGMDFKKEMEQIVGAEQVFDSLAILEEYSSDGGIYPPGAPLIVVKPKTTEQISKVISFANKHTLLVIPVSFRIYSHGTTIPYQGRIELLAKTGPSFVIVFGITRAMNKGGRHESKAVYGRESYWDAAGVRGRLGPRKEDRGGLPQSWDIGARLLRWRKEYGGLKSSQAKRIDDLERENSGLKKAVADLILDRLILREVLEENY